MYLQTQVARDFVCILAALSIAALTVSTAQQAGSDAGESKQAAAAITLSVNVTDVKQNLVIDLQRGNFTVYEDDQLQEITSFSREDAPASIGILVDNSGSMRAKRPTLTKAVVKLVQAINPENEVFIVNFNDDSYLDQDFTRDINLIHAALDRLDSRGGTALYDALVASADHLAKAGKFEKRVLLVITDGEDNESRESVEYAIRSVQGDHGPTIFAIGLLGTEGRDRRARRALEALAVQTGGTALFPRNLGEVDRALQALAQQIRSQYNIGYKPARPRTDGGYRRIKVVARSPEYQELFVHVTTGYFAERHP